MPTISHRELTACEIITRAKALLASRLTDTLLIASKAFPQEPRGAEDSANESVLEDLDEAIRFGLESIEPLRHELFAVLVIGAFGRRHSLSIEAGDRLTAFRELMARLLDHDA